MNRIRSIMLAAATVVCTAMMAQKSITSEVYWIDNDISMAQPVASVLDISALAAGLHTFTIRVLDSEGLWSSPVTKYFYVPHDVIEKATAIAEREYWIDSKIATRMALGESPAEISLVDLSTGLHSLTLRVKDDVGLWSSPETKYFIVPTSTEEATIVSYMYWFDDDTENIVSSKLDGPSGILPVDIGELTEGDHTISWRVGDSKGAWSDVKMESFTFTKTAITSAMITLAQESFEYNAQDIIPEVTVADGDTPLTKNEDYELSYSANHDAGEASVTVTGKGAYKESNEVSFTITKAPLTVTADDQTREKGQENPELTFTYSGWKGEDDESVLITKPVATTEATVDSPAAEYAIVISGGEAMNYDFTYIDGKLTITESTGIDGVIADEKDTDCKWYNLASQRLAKKPTAPGVYIHNGKKVTLK